MHTINAFLPLLRAGSLKKVITISTGVADLEFVLKSELALGAPYAISKAAVTMAVAKYAVQFKSEGFLFLALSPGFVNTFEQQRAYLTLFVIIASKTEHGLLREQLPLSSLKG